MASLRDLNLHFECLHAKNIAQLRILNGATLPVRYQDKFYKEMLMSENLTQLAYYYDVLIGAVCSRIEQIDPNTTNDDVNEKRQLYIMTMGVLAPYRGMGVGTKLLQRVLSLAEEKERCDVASVYLHVQVGNDHALRFYQRHGFAITGTIENYYKRIEPHDCLVLRREIQKG